MRLWRLWFSLHCVIMTVCSTKRNETIEPDPDGKIVGGKPVSMGQYPSACLFFNVGAQCAGTIINSWTILTAAHCFDKNKDKYEMVLEMESRYLYDFHARTYDVQEFVIHENYNRSIQFACDIALIFVTKKIRFGPRAKKAVLVNHNKWMTKKETRFVATGWGWTKYGGPVSDKGLLMTEMQFVSSQTCSELHNLSMTPDMFCLYGNSARDTCKGDSGGGILWNNMVVGITSHGDGCALLNKPSVYTNVWYFRNWIKKQINKFINGYCVNKKKEAI